MQTCSPETQAAITHIHRYLICHTEPDQSCPQVWHQELCGMCLTLLMAPAVPCDTSPCWDLSSWTSWSLLSLQPQGKCGFPSPYSVPEGERCSSSSMLAWLIAVDRADLRPQVQKSTTTAAWDCQVLQEFISRSLNVFSFLSFLNWNKTETIISYKSVLAVFKDRWSNQSAGTHVWKEFVLSNWTGNITVRSNAQQRKQLVLSRNEASANETPVYTGGQGAEGVASDIPCRCWLMGHLTHGTNQSVQFNHFCSDGEEPERKYQQSTMATGGKSFKKMI